MSMTEISCSSDNTRPACTHTKLYGTRPEGGGGRGGGGGGMTGEHATVVPRVAANERYNYISKICFRNTCKGPITVTIPTSQQTQGFPFLSQKAQLDYATPKLRPSYD